MRAVSLRRSHPKKNAIRPSPGSRSTLCQAERTEATRGKLLAAAKLIFAKDGFEAARLEDIAASAGYTRGAFYANFESKEDIFFALLEDYVQERIESLTTTLRQHSGALEQLAALRKHYAEVARDRRLVLISMEFKLYALRHPEAHARLQNLHRRIRASFGKLLSDLLRPLRVALPIENPAAISACLGSVAEGLLLERLVDAKTLAEDDVRRVLGLFFDTIFRLEAS